MTKKKTATSGYKKTLCTECEGLCCRYFALPIETPEDWDDYDDIRWYLAHERLKAADTALAEAERLLKNVKQRKRRNVALRVDVDKVQVQVLAKKEQHLRRLEEYDRRAREISRALGRDAASAPCASLVTRWNDVIPRYSIGYAQRMNDLVLALAVHLPGIDLAGSFVAGVSVEDVIARGRAVARANLQGAAAGVTR